MQIKIRSINKNPNYLADPDLTEWLIEYETIDGTLRKVGNFSITAIDSVSMELGIPSILKQILDGIKPLIQTDISTLKQSYNYDKSTKVLT